MKGLSENAKNWLQWLGNFGPTVRLEEFKGCRESSEGTRKLYLDPHDMAQLSAGVVEGALWLQAEQIDRLETQLACCCDVVNSWCREIGGVEQCENPYADLALRDVVNALWVRNNEKMFTGERKRSV